MSNKHKVVEEYRLSLLHVLLPLNDEAAPPRLSTIFHLVASQGVKLFGKMKKKLHSLPHPALSKSNRVNCKKASLPVEVKKFLTLLDYIPW